MVRIHPPSDDLAGETLVTEDFILLEGHTTRDFSLQKTQTASELAKSKSRRDLEQAYSNATLKKGPTKPVIPKRLDDGTFLVDWYDTDDPQNPQNWCSGKKFYVASLIWY